MRADRLLSLIMILQTSGTWTASQLAEELEVTERTIYRDMTALSTAGVPVYSIKGPGGGFALLEDYRTSLTGLNPDEVQALFMLSIPPVLEQLGVGEALRTALLKLSAALPESRRSDQVGARQFILLDPKEWYQSEESVPHLQVCQQAVWQQRMLEIIYQSEFKTSLEMHIASYGLVAKANRWYLVGSRAGNLRTLKVSQIQSARLQPEKFKRPQDFDLLAYWKAWCDEQETSRPRYPVKARVSPTLAQRLDKNQGLQRMEPPTKDTAPWSVVDLVFESLEEARDAVMSYGGACEVLEPLALRRAVADFAYQTLARYRG